MRVVGADRRRSIARNRPPQSEPCLPDARSRRAGGGVAAPSCSRIASLLTARRTRRQQVGPAIEGPLQRHLETPAADGLVVAAASGRPGCRGTAEYGRARVLRVLEEPVGERFLRRRGSVDRAREEADHGVDDDERGNSPPVST